MLGTQLGESRRFLDTIAISNILDKTFISIEAKGLLNWQEEISGVYETISKRMKRLKQIRFHLIAP